MPKLVIYLRMHSCGSFHCRGVNSFRACSALVLHGQTHVASTILVWTAVIFYCSETSGPLSTAGHLKLKCKVTRWMENLLEVKRGGSSEPLEPPLPKGLIPIIMYTLGCNSVNTTSNSETTNSGSKQFCSKFLTMCVHAIERCSHSS